MGRRGPTPTPTALKLLHGNPGRRPLNKREPKPRKGVPRRPTWLRGEARDHWDETVRQLQEMGVLTVADGDEVAAYCQMWARWRRTEDYLDEYGDVIEIHDEQGRVLYNKQAPQVSIARNLLQLLHQHRQDLGLTPSARTRLQVEKPSVEAAEFERFLASKPG